LSCHEKKTSSPLHQPFSHFFKKGKLLRKVESEEERTVEERKSSKGRFVICLPVFLFHHFVLRIL